MSCRTEHAAISGRANVQCTYTHSHPHTLTPSHPHTHPHTLTPSHTHPHRVIALEESLNKNSDVASMAGCRATQLPTGSVCAAQFSFNGCWYRGRVLEVEGQESRVQFLDYGNVEWVPNHLVQPIDPAALVLPFQAIECSFGMEHASKYYQVLSESCDVM